MSGRPRRFRVRIARNLALGAALAVANVSLAGATPPAPRIDWPAFLARQDLVWDRLPRGWKESAFIGNGRLGATIDERDGAFGWTINRTDVYHDDSRYPVGRVLLATAGKVTGGRARLALWNAEASGVVTTDRGEVRWRSFVPRSPEVIVVILEGRGGERGAALDWAPAEARPPRKVHNKVPFGPEDLHPAPTVTRSAGEITSVQPFVGGDAHAESIRCGAVERGTRVCYVAIGYATSAAPALREARAATAGAAHAGLARLARAHRTWWHRYYPESFVSFPDARLESYYWIQIYKLGAAMRPDGPILDLDGPWFDATPWPAIWWNLNIQLTYSPLFRANRIGLAESLFRNLDAHRQALIDNVPERLRLEAAAIGRSSGPDLVRKVDLATAQGDAAHEMGDLPWTLFYYWEYYRYTMDDRLLRERVYPLLRLAIGNYLAYVQLGDDGRYHLPPTESPELTTVADANYDLALLRWGLESLIASAERLHVSEPLLPRWKEVLAKLTPVPADSTTGLWVGRDRPWKQSHRHYSHLLAIYPLGLVTPDSARGRALIANSLRTWERDAALFRGYSFTGGASMHEMLGEGDTALARLNAFLDFPKYMEPNTFYAEAGPVIETPLSAATTIQEMFLQDWGGALRVFPAVPTTWKDASFADLRADGAFLVSGVRRGGRTAWVRITSLAGQPCRLVVADWRSAVVRSHTGPVPRLTRAGDGGFALALARGASVVLAPDRASPLPAVSPVARPAAERNPWPALPDGAGLSFDDLVRLERPRVLALADRYLPERPITITAYPAPRSAGGPHDYYSEGDYWWPDPAHPTGPYIRRDGETNPDNFVAHRDALIRFSQIVPALVAAYEITGDARYASRAVDHLRAWFVDERTRMNPALLYAQAIHGRATGRGIGIIDAIHLVEVAQAIRVLERMGYLHGETLAALKGWFADYLHWITSHPYGLAERDNGNNHSAAWALQVAEFAKLTGDGAALDSMRTFFTGTLLPRQMAADGSFPRELARTKPFGYSLFQLDVMSMLAEVLSTPAHDLWAYALPDGRGMRRALAFMYPYIADRRTWPKPPDVMYADQWPVRQPSLLFGGLALHEPKYIALWKRLNPEPVVPEVVRNFPVREPVLWGEP